MHSPVSTISGDHLIKFFAQAPAAIAVLQCPDLRFVMANERYQKASGRSDAQLLGHTLREVFPEVADQGFYEMFDTVVASGEAFAASGHPAAFFREDDKMRLGYYDFVAQPIKNESGKVEFVAIYATDVTDRIEVRRKIEEGNEFLQLAMDVADLGSYDFHPQTDTLKWSEKTKELFGLSGMTQVNFDLFINGIHPEDRDRAASVLQKALNGETGGLYQDEYRALGSEDKKIRWISSRGKVTFDSYGNATRLIGISQDITRRKIFEFIQQGQKLALELAVNGKPLEEVLKCIVTTAELQSTQKLFASIMIADDDEMRLLHGAAPSLPDAYNDSIHGTPIGPAVGSCGTAAYHRAMVIVEDIETDPLWMDFRYLARSFGLRSCTSIPILSSKGNLLGTFAVYYETVRKPSNEDIEVISLLSTTAGIIIEWYQDILIARQRQVALRESENQFRDLIEQATVATAVFENRDMILTVANEAMLNLWARPRSIIGQRLLDFMPELIGQPFPALLANVLKTGRTHKEENAAVTINRHGNLQTIYLDYSYKALRTAKGEPYGILVSAVDVTERFVTQRKIERSEQRFRDLIREASVGIVVLTGEEMRVEIVNEAYARIIGSTTENLLGRPIFEVIPETASQYQPLLENVRTTQVPIILYDTPYTITTNREKIEGFLHVVYQPYRDINGKVLGVMAIVQDVTEAVHSRKAVEESEERFRTLATNIPHIVWTANPDGTVDYLSKQWQELTGQSPEEGMTAPSKVIHPEDLKVVNHWWHEAQRTGDALRLDYRLKNLQTGEYRWFTVLVQSLKDKDGHIFKWIGTALDIHDQKLSAERLEAQVAERTKELTQSNEDLQQFAHVASHDLKEPVRKIKTFGNRLSLEMKDQLDERGRTYVKKILHASDRMLTMIEGVLTYSTLNAAMQEPTKVSLSDIVEDIIKDLEVSIGETGAKVAYSNLPTIEGAEVLLYQLFYNLINNSLKFRRTDVAPVIKINGHRVDKSDLFSITVQDNGIGFDQRYADRIFNTFTRLNTKDEFEGTGLGLALCKKIVERHGGKIEAKSVKGDGATFTIVLPERQHKTEI
ncbi:PAS domain S-box protein [Chryseolinea sp. T2]|uniref:PAS domain S-box protein n=1 Tax=Chryseolinea sp. T2 TaxID=3129255 RepID=UPI00307746C3